MQHMLKHAYTHVRAGAHTGVIHILPILMQCSRLHYKAYKGQCSIFP